MLIFRCSFFNDDEAIVHLKAVLEVDAENSQARQALERLEAAVKGQIDDDSLLLVTPVKPVLRSTMIAAFDNAIAANEAAKRPPEDEKQEQ
jgi:hypothetical protein